MINNIPPSLLAAVIGVISNKKVVTESTGVQFYSDIPNDQWLNDKQRLANSMYNENNKGIIGSVTGSFNKPVKLPVDFLKNVPGHRGEHAFREDPTSEKSKEIEQKASVSGFNTEKHPIYVTVNHRGIPYINEGNHRLGYAIRHGLKSIHANVEYFNGGEISVTGALHPDAIKKYNTENTVNESVEHPMIDVDGEQKHRHNSMGQPIHHTDEGIRNFHRWFGDSNAVDEHGRPKVMYHGTGAILTKKGTEGGIREFKTKNDLPHWVTDDPKLAHGYAGSSNTSNILPVYIKSHHPYKSDVRSDDDWAFSKNDVKTRILQQSPVQDKSALNDRIKDLFSSVPYSEHRYQSLWNAAGAATRFKNMGFDSIHHFERGANTYAVMDSNQVKSAIGNAGRFKSKSNQIDESVEEHPMIDVDGQMKHRHNSLGQPIHHTDEGIRNFHRWFGDSKAVDEHGRPLVVYHGSNAHAYSGGSIERFHTNTERGAAFFSSHPEIARQYGEKLYSTYVRLNNPLIIDGDNRSWSDLNPNLKISGNITPELRVADQKKTKDLNNIFSQLGDLFGDDDSSSQAKPKFEGHTNLKHVLSDITDKTTTDDVAKHAKKLGYDGVIFRNIKDSPVHDVKMYKPTSSHIYAVFKPSGVKSTQNSGKFHPDSIITESEEYHEEHPMIEVDGQMKHRLNSLRQPIYHTDEGIKNFHRWFGDSKAVDNHGRPNVYYRMTDSDRTEFRKSWRGGLIYFAARPEGAERATRAGSGATYPVYIKATKIRGDKGPGVYFGDAEAKGYEDKLQKDGYDAVKVRDEASRHGGTIAVLDPGQIKSAIGNTGAFSHPTKINESEDYREEHTSPDPDSGAPAHNLSSNGVYPDDFYSSKGVQYYGDGRNDDKIVHAHLKSLRNRPEADVKIYRAVPNKDEIKDINPGDWVTTNLEYAKDHGEARFDNHKILTKNVKAKELFTDGNSFHEFGYHPVKQQHTMTDSVRRAYINMTND